MRKIDKSCRQWTIRCLFLLFTQRGMSPRCCIYERKVKGARVGLRVKKSRWWKLYHGLMNRWNAISSHSRFLTLYVPTVVEARKYAAIFRRANISSLDFFLFLPSSLSLVLSHSTLFVLFCFRALNELVSLFFFRAYTYFCNLLRRVRVRFRILVTVVQSACSLVELV